MSKEPNEVTKAAMRELQQLGQGLDGFSTVEAMMADLTRPQPSAEPVAWMYANEAVYDIYDTPNPKFVEAGLTETPLYPASALEAARREGLEQVLEQARDIVTDHRAWIEENPDRPADCLWSALGTLDLLVAHYSLKENTNAG